MVRSRFLGIVLVMAVGGIPVAPPEHVHETDDHGHAHLLVHRHLTFHTANHHADGHEGVIDDNDTPVLTLDAVYTVPPMTSPLAAPVPVAAALIEPAAPSIVTRNCDCFERRIHGPPRSPTGLRAPPYFSRL